MESTITQKAQFVTHAGEEYVRLGSTRWLMRENVMTLTECDTIMVENLEEIYQREIVRNQPGDDVERNIIDCYQKIREAIEMIDPQRPSPEQLEYLQLLINFLEKERKGI